MARSINRIHLLGRVGLDPDMRYTPGGTPITRLRLATDRPGSDEPDWHTVLCWGRPAEVVNVHVKKGDRVFVADSLRSRTFEDREGKSWPVAEVHAEEVVFLEPRQNTPTEAGGQGEQPGDLPF